MRTASFLSRYVAVAAGLTLALAACTSPPTEEETVASDAPSAVEETTTEAEPTEEPTETEAPTEEPADTGLIELQIGDTFTTDNGNEITAHEVQLDIPYDWESEGGGAWHAVDVSYCLGDTLPELIGFQEFTIGWILRTEEGYVLDYPGSWSDDIVQPMLDLYNVTPVANECYRGWVLLDGPADPTVTSVRFYEVDWSFEPAE